MKSNLDVADLQEFFILLSCTLGTLCALKAVVKTACATLPCLLPQPLNSIAALLALVGFYWTYAAFVGLEGWLTLVSVGSALVVAPSVKSALWVSTGTLIIAATAILPIAAHTFQLEVPEGFRVTSAVSSSGGAEGVVVGGSSLYQGAHLALTPTPGEGLLAFNTLLIAYDGVHVRGRRGGDLGEHKSSIGYSPTEGFGAVHSIFSVGRNTQVQHYTTPTEATGSRLWLLEEGARVSNSVVRCLVDHHHAPCMVLSTQVVLRNVTVLMVGKDGALCGSHVISHESGDTLCSSANTVRRLEDSTALFRHTSERKTGGEACEGLRLFGHGLDAANFSDISAEPPMRIACVDFGAIYRDGDALDFLQKQLHAPEVLIRRLPYFLYIRWYLPMQIFLTQETVRAASERIERTRIWMTAVAKDMGAALAGAARRASCDVTKALKGTVWPLVVRLSANLAEGKQFFLGVYCGPIAEVAASDPSVCGGNGLDAEGKVGFFVNSSATKRHASFCLRTAARLLQNENVSTVGGWSLDVYQAGARVHRAAVVTGDLLASLRRILERMMVLILPALLELARLSRTVIRWFLRFCNSSRIFRALRRSEHALLVWEWRFVGDLCTAVSERALLFGVAASVVVRRVGRIVWAMWGLYTATGFSTQVVTAVIQAALLVRLLRSRMQDWADAEEAKAGGRASALGGRAQLARVLALVGIPTRRVTLTMNFFVAHYQQTCTYVVRHLTLFFVIVGLSVFPFCGTLYHFTLLYALPWVSSQAFVHFFSASPRHRHTAVFFLLRAVAAVVIQCTGGSIIHELIVHVISIVGLLFFFLSLIWFSGATAPSDLAHSAVRAFADGIQDTPSSTPQRDTRQSVAISPSSTTSE